jgi:hypothetical protein
MPPESTFFGDKVQSGTLMNILDSLQKLSNEFADYLEETIDSAGTMAAGDRVEATAAAADLGFEHAFAVRTLFEAGAPNSASAILRLQYEALLRAAWLLYAATDAEVSKAGAELNLENVSAAKSIAGAGDMLKALERCLETQPELRGLVVPLREIRDASWSALNGFVHGGLHPLARTRDGFPDALAANLLKFSNGMLHLTARISARLTGSSEALKKIEQSISKFSNALPVIVKPTA